MKSLLLVDSRIMLLDCMYCSIASLITGDEGGRMDIGDEVVVSGDCMCPSHAGLQHRHHLHGYCARASLITDDEGGGREGGDEVVVSVQQDHVARPHVPRHAWLQHRHHLHRYYARASLITDDEVGGMDIRDEVGMGWDGGRDEVVVVSGQQDHVA